VGGCGGVGVVEGRLQIWWDAGTRPPAGPGRGWGGVGKLTGTCLPACLPGGLPADGSWQPKGLGIWLDPLAPLPAPELRRAYRAAVAAAKAAPRPAPKLQRTGSGGAAVHVPAVGGAASGGGAAAGAGAAAPQGRQGSRGGASRREEVDLTLSDNDDAASPGRRRRPAAAVAPPRLQVQAACPPPHVRRQQAQLRQQAGGGGAAAAGTAGGAAGGAEAEFELDAMYLLQNFVEAGGLGPVAPAPAVRYHEDDSGAIVLSDSE